MKSNFLLMLTLLLSSLRLLCQQSTENTTVSNAWTEVGPSVEIKQSFSNKRNGNGRVDAIWVDPTNPDRIYIGCRGGGLWTTINAGASWTPKTDALEVTGVNCMAVNPANINEIYIATITSNGSSGIYKSTDAGDSWSSTGSSFHLSDRVIIHRIIMDPLNPSILFAATSLGIHKSTDGFQTYVTVYDQEVIDIEFKPGDPSILYAADKNGKTIFRSSNSGASFNATGLTGINKPQIAVSANQPNYVYVSGNGVLYRSIDNGMIFTQQGVPDAGKGQYGGFAVSDMDANLLINGSLDTYRSTDGGSTFSKVTDWIYNQSTGVGGNFVHADIREVEIVNGVIYLGTDGWLCKSTDGGINYEILTFNVGNNEIYRHGLGVSQSEENTLVTGTQDNGTNIFRNGTWYQWKGGDGGTSLIDHSDADVIYGSLFNGDFKRTDDAGSSASNVDLGDTKAGKNNPSGSLPPLVQHPTSPSTIFLGEAQGQIWKSTDKGANWTTFAELEGGGMIDELGVAPSDGNYIYASINEKIWRTTDGGINWTEITGSLPVRTIIAIAVNYQDPDKVSVSYSDYTDGEKVYTTTNGGSNWTNISRNLPNVPTYDIIYHNTVHNALFVATQTGVYYTEDAQSGWTEFGLGLPNVRVSDLEIQHSSATLYTATWGRGVWKIPLGLETHYTFSNNIEDTSSYERDLSVMSDLLDIPLAYTTDKDGAPLSALQFTETNNQYLEPNFLGISGKQERTVMAWVKTTYTDTQRMGVVSWGTNTPGGFFDLTIKGGGVRIKVGAGTENNKYYIKTANGLVNDGAWHHIAVTAPANATLADCKIYIDGVLTDIRKEDHQHVEINTVVLGNLRIGQTTFSSSSSFRSGALDDIRIYSRELTVNEINAVLNGSN